MSDVAMPISTPSRWLTWTVGAVVALAAMAGYGLYARWGATSAAAAVAGDYFTIAPMAFDRRVVKDGEMQSVNNIDIVSQVEGQTMINTLVKEGSFVKKGDVLVTLDGSAIKQKIDDTSLTLEQSEADLAAAKDAKEIQESQNDANLDASTVALDLAKLDYQQYVEGTYPQSVADANTDLAMAKITLRDAQEDLANTKSLYAKGFVTGADIEKSDLAVTTAVNGVDKAQTALEVLTKYTHAEDLASKQNAVAQAEKNLGRTKQQNQANLAQKISDVEGKTQARNLLKERMAHYQQQLADCTINAPADGMVVYSSSVDRNAETQIEEGAQVRERQPLLRLPDTSKMKAIIRIQEGMVGQLKEGQRAAVHIVNLSNPIGATITKISVLVDSSQRWWNPDLKEYPVELTLDQTPVGLKPGMGVRVEIMVDHLNNVLAVPLPAIYATGPTSYVFVRNPGGDVRPVKVTLGATNETHAQILQGVSAGDQVLVLQTGQGRDLLEKAGMTATTDSAPHEDSKPPA
jgi:HlyD family secretion protein